MPYKDKDKKRARDLQWYHANKEKIKPRMREYNKTHRKCYAELTPQTRKYFADKRNERSKMLRNFIQEQKIGRSCIRCGISDPRVLDFHHLDSGIKEAGLAQAPSKNWSIERILQEIAKGETLCANCHRILHWEERNSEGMPALAPRTTAI